MKKNILLILMAFAFSLAFISCGSSENAEESNADSLNQTEEMAAKPDFTKGMEVYKAHCQVCHQAEGAGLAGAFPALKGLAAKNIAKETILDNIKNGKKSENYPAPMVPVAISDEEAAAVADYILSLK